MSNTMPFHVGVPISSVTCGWITYIWKKAATSFYFWDLHFYSGIVLQKQHWLV